MSLYIVDIHGEIEGDYEIIGKIEEPINYKDPRWIPVSERLPEDYEEVIASVNHEYVYSNARYSKKYGWEWAAEYSCDYWTDLKGVDAWMPLPKAYNPESEEKRRSRNHNG